MFTIRTFILSLIAITNIMHGASQIVYQPENTIIAFDIHDVIAHTDIYGMCNRAVNFEKKQEVLLRMFQIQFLKKLVSSMWKQLTFQNILPICDKYNPALSELMLDMATEQALKPEVVEILKKLKAAGYTLHIVSNIERRSLDVLKIKYPDVFDVFTVEYIPYTHHQKSGKLIRKPDHKFFNDYLMTCVPEGHHVIFVDDLPKNIAGAAACGMHALMFINATELKYALEKLTLITDD